MHQFVSGRAPRMHMPACHANDRGTLHPPGLTAQSVARPGYRRSADWRPVKAEPSHGRRPHPATPRMRNVKHFAQKSPPCGRYESYQERGKDCLRRSACQKAASRPRPELESTMTTQNLGKYTVLSQLGETRLGKVYQCQEDLGRRTVWIHLCDEAPHWGPAEKERFKLDCAALNTLQHPGIVPLVDYGELGDRLYQVTEALEGETLQEMLIHQPPVSVEKTVFLMAQAAEALGYAHSLGISHAALTPSLIHILPDGNIRISGFATGGLLRSSVNREAGRPEASLYLSPEESSGRPADARSDLFSLGLVFYQAITGRHPFEGSSPAETIENIIGMVNFPSIDRYPDLPLGLWPILERCLAKKPEDRYTSGTEMSLACRELLKDMADDRQLMLVELHTVLPRLAEATQRPGVPASLVELRREVEELLASEQVMEYVPLNRMISVLAEHYKTLHFAFGDSGAYARAVVSGEGARAAASGTAEAPAVEAVPFTRQPDIVSSAGTAGLDPAQTADQPPDLFPQADRVPGGEAEGPASEPSRDWTAQAPSPEAASPMPARRGAPLQHQILPGEVADLLREMERQREEASHPVKFQTPDETTCEEEWDPTQEEARQSPPASPPPPIPLAADAPLLPDMHSAEQAKSPWENAPAREIQKGAESMVDSSSSGFGAWFGEEEDPVDPDGTVAAGRPAKGWRDYFAAVPARYRRAALTAAAAVLLLVLIIWIGSGLRSRRGLFVILGDARQKVATALFGDPQPALRKIEADTSAAFSLPLAAGGGSDPVIVAVLVEQAKALRELGRADESQIFLQRALEIDPEHEAALSESQQLQAAMIVGEEQSRQEEMRQRALAAVARAIEAGRMRQARLELDRIERLWPGSPEIRSLRQTWDRKNAELTQEQRRREAEQAESARQKEEDARRARRIDDLFRQGRYEEARNLTGQWSAESPQDPAAQRMQRQSAAAIETLSTYQAAMGAKRYQDALNALTGLEQINPADPNLAELRARAESRKAAARATLSVYRLGAPAEILLDGQPLGGGEVVAQEVSVGAHMLLIRGAKGGQTSRSLELMDGMAASYVYDSGNLTLRPMVESDRSLLAERKVKEETHSFAVEHPHGLLRGSCKGELLVSFYDVSFKPVSGTHGFTIPFRNLKLRSEDRTIRLLLISDNREIAQFKVADPQTAAAMADVWERLKKINQ